MSGCPQPCRHLSQEDAREGAVCSAHPCTCEPEAVEAFIARRDSDDASLLLDGTLREHRLQARDSAVCICGRMILDCPELLAILAPSETEAERAERRDRIRGALASRQGQSPDSSGITSSR